MAESEVREWQDGVVAKCTAAMEKIMSSNDPSHDELHVGRVRRLAMAIAAKEIQGPFLDTWFSLLVVETAALFHDVNDWKYGDSGEAVSIAGLINEAVGPSIPQWLSGKQSLEELIKQVTFVCDYVSFSKELSPGYPTDLPMELRIVQDADRLEAIGALGICRCFTYGARKNRKFYNDASIAKAKEHINSDSTDTVCTDIKQEEYMNTNRVADTISHFDEKLFKLMGMMKTATGKRIAEKRHAFMKQFTDQFYTEVLCLDA